MTFRVRLTAEAVRNQNEIADWIAERSASGALSWLDALDRVLQQLSKNPLSFPLAVEEEVCDKELRNALFGTQKGRVFLAIFWQTTVDVQKDCRQFCFLSLFSSSFGI